MCMGTLVGRFEPRHTRPMNVRTPAAMLHWFLTLGLALAATACDSPKALCEDLADNTCKRAVECVAPDEDPQVCSNQVQASLDCSLVTDVSDGYDTCMSRISDDSCASLFPNDMLELPGVCRGVLLIE